MSDPIPESQDWLIEKIEAFGYEVPSIEGLCFGIANMAMQSFLADNDMTEFNARLKFLNQLSIAGIKRYKNEPVNTVVRIKSRNNRSLLDLQAFLDGVMLYQEPENYVDITSSRHQQERAASSIITPAELDTDTKRPVSLNNAHGAYCKEELITYLNLLQQSIDVTAAFLLQSSNHGINLNFNPKSREWLLIDANELPVRKFSDPEQLAVAIIDAFDATRDTTNHAVFKTTVFTRASDAKRLQTSLDGVMNHSSWKEIHQINEHKAAITDAFNANLLLLAASHGDEDIILQSINAGVDVNCVRKEDGVTPLYLAAQNGHLGAVSQLIDAHASVNQSTKKNVTPIYSASQKGHAGIVQKLIEAGASVNQECYREKREFPLYIAAQNGHQDVVRLLLEAGAEVNKVREDGYFPLFIASRFGHLSIVKELMQSGAEIDQRNDYNESALYTAAFNGQTEVVRTLLDAGAEVNLISKKGITPLYVASQNGHDEVVRLLLEKNANPNIKADDKPSPLGIAAHQGYAEIVYLLLRQEGINIDYGVKYEYTPLYLAVMNGHYPIVEQLLKAGADANLIFGDGSSPLTLAIANGDLQVVNALLRAGADVGWIAESIGESAEILKHNISFPVQEAGMSVLKAYYERYLQECKQAQQILTRYGITKNNIASFYSLKRQNNDEVIPKLLLDGKSIGYDNVYLKKLDTMSVKGAALAACLGKMTNSSQYLGDTDSERTVHGITSPYGGFYVLCRGDADNPSLDDQIVAQSWVWQGKGGALCLDLVESTDTIKTDIVSDMFRFLSHTLCRVHGLDHVNIGANSSINKQVTFHNTAAPEEHFKDYTGHRSSQSQYLLADRTRPYLFYDEVSAPELKAMIVEDARIFFSMLLSEEVPYRENEPLQEAISFCLGKEKNELLLLLQSCVNDRKAEFEAMLTANRDYIEQLVKFNINFDAIERGANINAVTWFGESALHRVLRDRIVDVAVMKKLLALGINPNIRSRNGHTPLSIAFDNFYFRKNEQGREIAKLLIDAGADLEAKHDFGNTPLISAVRNNDLAMVKYLLEKGADIEGRDNDMKTPLFWAAEKGHVEIFNYLFEQQARLDIVNKRGYSPLLIALRERQHAITNKILSETDVDILHANIGGYNALHYAADDPVLLTTMLTRLSEKQALEGVKRANQEGETVLHLAADVPESLQILLNLYPKEQRLEAVLLKDKWNKSLLHKVARNPKSLKTVLDSLPDDKKRDAINKRSLLHEAVGNLASFKMMLGLYPTEQVLDAINMKDNRGRTVLFSALYNPESLLYILQLYPEDQILDAITTTDRDGWSPLLEAIKNSEYMPNALEIMLEHLPQEQRLMAFMMKSKNGIFSGIPMLHFVSCEQLPTILKFLPEHHRLAFLRFEDEGASIAEAIIKNLPLPKTENSFAGDYLTIYSIIKSYTSPQKSSFFSNTSVERLVKQIDRAQSFDAIKKSIQDFVKSEQNELAKKLIQTFEWCRKPIRSRSYEDSEEAESSIQHKVKKLRIK